MRALATAEDYQRHYLSEVTGHLQAVTGLRRARLLRQHNDVIVP